MRSGALLIGAALLAAPALAQDAAQLEADRARQALERAAADARAQAVADQARMARQEAERLAAEARYRADESNARQRALLVDHERRRAEAEAQRQAAQAEADLARRAAEQRVRVADEEARRGQLDRRAPAEPIPGVRREPVPPTPSYRYSTVRPARPAAAPPRAAVRREGVALCQQATTVEWRCTGPATVSYGDLARDRAAVLAACGAATVRDLGRVQGGLRAFGCGFGIDPWSFEPGNHDVPALFRVEVPGRRTYPN